MKYQYIDSKFFIPIPRKRLIQRELLLNLLTGGVNNKLILVSAPAGYGKTSLIVSWLKSNKKPVIWFSIDSEDNDYYRYFSYILEAFTRVIPPVGKKLLEKLSSSMPPTEDDIAEQFLIELSTLPTDCILVLDDRSEE